ncbi:uncharacterized protein LOC107040394 [Diachasma alloeum]|uniref:uncharacterized protein LOC107040394 n=1 Tax=Diachasma alloeum TaxID=454923 RepID=UPI0007383317|nr:uncharacterized protein LOC107040394 [Diachasma alloeum]
MGIVFNQSKVGSSYKSPVPRQKSHSQRLALKGLSPQNVKYLKSLGLKLRGKIHAHQPFAASTLINNDEIRIAVQHQDLYVLPCKSSLHICGRLTKADGTTVTTATKFVNNGICHLFEEIRYKLNAVEVDRCKNVGVTTLMKNYISQSPSQTFLLENAGWIMQEDTKMTDNEGYFNISIPLSMILGFAEDYQRIIMNAKHELILTRSHNDINAVLQAEPAQGAVAETFKISLTKLEWMIPYIKVADSRKVQLLNYIAKDTPTPISFRAWELYEYPLLPRTSKHLWVVKCSTQLEKPRYVIVGFQSFRKNHMYSNASKFDHCSIRDVKLFLNSQSYPYGNLNLDIAHNQYALLYNMYTDFQASYYAKEPDPLLNRETFLKTAPLIVIDCSKQNEFLKSGPVDIRLEFESTQTFPDTTTAYCSIIHDRIIEYKPFSGGMKKMI